MLIQVTFICRHYKLILIKLIGVELPINVVVIIVMCIIVLLSVMVLFILTWTSGSSTINLQSVKSNACQKLASSNCESDTSSISVENFDANKDGKVNEAGNGVDDTSAACKTGGGGDDNLYMLCKCWFSVNEQVCKNSICGCISGSTAGSSGGGLPPLPCSDDTDCPSGKHCVSDECV